MDKWKMVPVEPDEAMMLNGSGCRHHAFDDMGCVNRKLRHDIYANMLASAPAPAFDEAAEREAFHLWFYASGLAGFKETAWAAWEQCAKHKAGVQ